MLDPLFHSSWSFLHKMLAPFVLSDEVHIHFTSMSPTIAYVPIENIKTLRQSANGISRSPIEGMQTMP